MTTAARNRLNIRVYQRCGEQEWRKAQARYFREKRRQETRAWVVRAFKAFALVIAAVAGFCAATFGSK